MDGWELGSSGFESNILICVMDYWDQMAQPAVHPIIVIRDQSLKLADAGLLEIPARVSTCLKEHHVITGYLLIPLLRLQL